jgi:intracellular septation protein
MRLGAFFFEILPLAGFFIGYHYLGLLIAAAISVCLSLLVLLVARFRERRFAVFPMFSLIISALFTLAAMLFEAAIFIKIQPTLFNGAFAIVLFAGLFRGKAMMRVFFGDQFSLTDDTWFRLSFRWACFFLFLAVANEFAWRLLDEAGWVMFKTFFAAPASMLFMLAQLPLTLRGRINGDDDMVVAKKE